MNEMKKVKKKDTKPKKTKVVHINKSDNDSNNQKENPQTDYSDFSEMEEVNLNESTISTTHNIRVGREFGDKQVNTDKPYQVIIIGFSADKTRRDGEPARFHFSEDISYFESYNLANEYINTQTFIDSLSSTEMFNYMVKRFNSNLPFYTIMQVIIKHNAGSVPCYYPGKEIEVSGFFNKHHFSAESLDIQDIEAQENKPKN